MNASIFKTVSEIKVGVIGYGATCEMGKRHLGYAQDFGMKAEAVVDPDENRLAAARDDFPGIATFTSVDEMLKKTVVNLVVIITPHNTHKDLALQCLKANCHVICEKPFAITTADCDEMIAEANSRGLLVTTYHNRHWCCQT